MSNASSVAIDGRSASIARRRALSAGKTSLPPATERVRGARTTVAPAPAHAAPASDVPTPAVEPATPANHVAKSLTDGRHVSMLRRRALSNGKSALNGSGSSTNGAPAAVATSATLSPIGSCREQARARRAEQCLRGRGEAAPALPRRERPVVTIEAEPATAEHRQAPSGLRVTGMQSGVNSPVTGATRGASLPVSGTHAIANASESAWRAGVPKVGHALTNGGTVVSGSLVRSKVAVTGDEAGDTILITGQADGRIEADVTARADGRASSSAQFARQANPHGHSALGANLGRSAQAFGSRERSGQRALESTESGLPVTGSAVGRSLRVTGDETGACRTITGNQYMAPARNRAECGGAAGGTAATALTGAGRIDPASGAKVSVARTWSAQRVTGVNVEAHGRVSGTGAGTCAAITGTPYQGPGTLADACDDSAVDAVESRVAPRRATAHVTGDTPINDRSVTGTARGAGHEISGTPYYRETTDAPVAGEPVVQQQERFSVRSPQRDAQLSAATRANGRSGAEAITGSFDRGAGKVTGNLEFVFRSRRPAEGAPAPARLAITGEGRPSGRAITGSAWSEHRNVGGTEGSFSSERNPSERTGAMRRFAGAAHFKELASVEDPKHLVTGMFGYASDNAAKVTLSGGAQG